MKTIGGSIHKCQKVCWLLTCISLHFLAFPWCFICGETPAMNLWLCPLLVMALWLVDVEVNKAILQLGWNLAFQRTQSSYTQIRWSKLLMSPTLTHFDILDHFGMLFADCLLMVFQGSSLSRHVTWHIERLSVYLRRLSLMQAERFCQSFIFFFKDWWQNIPVFFTPNF